MPASSSSSVVTAAASCTAGALRRLTRPSRTADDRDAVAMMDGCSGVVCCVVVCECVVYQSITYLEGARSFECPRDA